MFKQVLKYTLAAVIWKRYRSLIIATVALFVYFWLVGTIHDDYVAVSEKKGEIANLGLSFALKWVFLLLGQGVYLLFLMFWRRAPISAKKTAQAAAQRSQAPSQTPNNSADDEEPETFKRLREKPKLRSKSDIIIEKYPPKS